MAKLVSRTYGDALFHAACEDGRMDQIYEEVQQLGEILKANPGFQALMENPKIMREEKQKVIETTFQGKISDEITGLMLVMMDKGRYGEIDSVFEYFTALVKEEKKIGTAYVSTAVELTGAQKDAVEKRLLETTGYREFEIQYTVDPALIGGMVIRIGDRVVDSSIRTKLYELSKNLKRIQV